MTILTLDAANLFLGDDDQSNGQFLTLKSIKLPSLREMTKDHTPGGGVMAMKLGLRSIEALEFTFKLEGFNLAAMSKFMPATATNYTIRGNIRDIQTHQDIGMTAVVRGRMQSVEAGDFSRDSGIEHDYMITEVTRYSLIIGSNEKYYFDVFAGAAGARIDGVPMFANLASNLGLV